MKALSIIDRIIIELEHSLRASQIKPPTGLRPYPAINSPADDLNDTETALSRGLMRVNNAGEVAAQGLYRGQAVTAHSRATRLNMLEAAAEENEHLNWCQTRMAELGTRRSALDPFWYWGSFSLGAAAGLVGDKWSLGFVEETENQVAEHLKSHLKRLPPHDHRSRSIINTMREDEIRHAVNAHHAGAAKLPKPIQKAMSMVSKIMTFSAYRI